jgi:uncharacterized cofD-like protein
MAGTDLKSRTQKMGKWLYPGMRIKRWLFLFGIGTLCISVGLAIWIDLKPVFYTGLFLSGAVRTLAKAIPNEISGPLVLISGLSLMFWGFRKAVSSITEVLGPEDEDLVDLMFERRRLTRGAKIVVIGGGTGLSTLLRGIKAFSSNITAVVTVADDGGSSGRLRKEFGVLPPGDIRNCLAALADEEKLITELFQYRFTSGEGLAGHSFGNLFLTAMADVTGDLEKGIEASARVLAIRGRVLPATLEDVRLWAEFEDGRRVEGESNIPEAGGKITRVGCIPESPKALPEVIRALQEADLIIIGPGSLYTSVIPNLLVPEISAAIAASDAQRVYICNIMTQQGETDNFSVADHVQAIEKTVGYRIFDTVLMQKDNPRVYLDKYRQEGSQPVRIDRERLALMGIQLVLAHVLEENHEKATIRHNSRRLARAAVQWYLRKIQAVKQAS